MALPSSRRLLLGALVLSLCATAALAIAILLLGDFGETEGRILGTTALISGYSLLMLPAGILVDQRRALPLAWGTFAGGALAFALAIALVWGATESETVAKVAFTLTAVTATGTQAGATLSRLRSSDTRGVRTLFAVGTGLVVVLAAMVAVAIWSEIDSSTYYRVLAAVAVANVLVIVLQPVLRRLAGVAERPAYSLRLRFADGAGRELAADGRDFAEAVARAIREAERDGREVAGVERLGAP